MKFTLGAAVLLLLSGLTQAQDSKLHVMSAFAPATFKLAMNGAAYVNAHNMSDMPVQITALSVDEKVASRTEMHETLVENEMARMREIELPLSIPPGEALSMQPGGRHIMLLGLKQPLSKGQAFDLTLTFADGSEQTVTVKVDEQEEATDHSHHHH